MSVEVVKLGIFACEALFGGKEEQTEHLPVRLVTAMRVYLGDKETNRPGWRYPDFAREAGAEQRAEVVVNVDEELWSAFASEAADQGVSIEQLVEHAALYFAAELDSGRVTERILDQMDDA